MTSCVVNSAVRLILGQMSLNTFIVCISVCHLFQINAEFKRITTMPLKSRFISQLDLNTANLLIVFEKSLGQQGQKLKDMSAMVTVRILT